MKPKLTERSERKFVAEFDPHTNWSIAKSIFPIGVGVQFADAGNIKDISSYNLCRPSDSISYLLIVYMAGD